MARYQLYKPFFQLSMVIMVAILGTTLVTTWSSQASALEYTDHALMLKDFEHMQNIVLKIKRTDFGIDDPDESIRQKAKNSLFVIFSRRDRDGTRAQLVNNVQADLEAADYYDVINEIGDSAIKNAKDPKVSVEERSTYLMVLENILSEYRPLAKNQMRALFTRIRDADIDPGDEVVRYRQIKMTESAPSPSEIAKEKLKQI